MTAVNKVQVVLSIDSSGSMKSNDYLNAAINDSNSFLNIMLDDDAIGVVTFKDTASYIYDNGASPPKVKILDEAILPAVSQAISGLKASGNTNIQQGLDYSVALINSSDKTRNPAIILLSDGYANRGTRPPVVPAQSPPIYTIALGPNSEQGILQTLATKSGGTYHLSPDSYDLAIIYFQIAAETGTITRIVSADIVKFNTDKAIGTAPTNAPTGVQTMRTAGQIPAGTSEIRLAVTWLEDTVYVTDTPTADNQFSLKVYQNGKQLTLPPPKSRSNYLTFHLNTPAAGVYVVETSYLGSRSFQPTVALLDYGTDTSPTIVVDVERNAKLGQPVNLTASLHGTDGQPLSDVTFTGSISAPAIAATEAYQTTEADLSHFYATDGEASEDLSLEHVQSLSQRIAAYGPLPKIRRDFTAIRKQSDAQHNHYSFIPQVPGVYLLRLQAEYHGGATDSHFTQTAVVTLNVT